MARKPLIFPRFKREWAEMDSNHRRRKPADLQSAPFGHFGIYPFGGGRGYTQEASLRKGFAVEKMGAGRNGARMNGKRGRVSPRNGKSAITVATMKNSKAVRS